VASNQPSCFSYYTNISVAASTDSDMSQDRWLYSVRLRTFGNANQQTIMTAYIPIATGCSTQVPTDLVSRCLRVGQGKLTGCLSEDTSCEWSDCPTRTSCSANETDCCGLNVTRHEARKDGLRARVDRAQQQAQQAYSNRISDQVGRQPCQKLEAYCADCEDDDKFPLAYPGRSVGEHKTTKGDAGLFSD
jgi:hypothetical protein